MTTANPFEYSKDPELNRMFDAMVALKARVAQKFEQAERMAGFVNNSGFQALDDAKIELPALSYLREPNSSWRFSSKASLEQVEQQARNAVRVAREEIARVEALNKDKIAANTLLVSQIKDFMTRLGFAETYSTYEFANSRSRTRREVRHTAGYLGDIQRMRPCSNTTSMTLKVDAYEKSIADYIRIEREKEMRAKNEDDARVMAQILNEHASLIELLIRNGVNIMEVLNTAPAGGKKAALNEAVYELRGDLLDKDKYLALAYAMESCRHDFSNGPDGVQNALHGFMAVTNREQEMVDSIQHTIDNWDGDGRIFRDCEYDYNYVYGEVQDQNLVNTVRTLGNYLGDV